MFLVMVILVRSIKELVQVEKNGLLFSSSSELADELLVSLVTWFQLLQMFKYTGSDCSEVLLVSLSG